MEDVPHVTSAKAHVEIALRQLNIPTQEDENFMGTSLRWVKYIKSYTVHFDAANILAVTFPLKHKSDDPYDRPLIVQVGIPYRAVCAHHLLPVLGTAHVGYIPEERVVGLSKLARLVYGISHRLPSLQEDVCDEVTQDLMEHLNPMGAMCMITAEHGCMSARGVEEATGCISTVTTSVKGLFIEKHELRDEFYQMVRQGQK